MLEATATVREMLEAEYGEDWRGFVWHFLDVIEDYRGNFVILNHTMGYDVHGYADAVGVSNYRVLRDAWADVEGMTRGPYSGSDHICLELDSAAPSDLLEVLEALESYPVLDDSVWSEVEAEQIDEHWDSYGLTDTLEAVAKALEVDHRSDLSDYAEDTVKALVWFGVLDYGHGGGYPVMIDVSAVDFGTDAVGAWVLEHVTVDGGTVILERWPGDDMALAVNCDRAAWLLDTSAA